MACNSNSGGLRTLVQVRHPRALDESTWSAKRSPSTISSGSRWHPFRAHAPASNAAAPGSDRRTFPARADPPQRVFQRGPALPPPQAVAAPHGSPCAAPPSSPEPPSALRRADEGALHEPDTPRACAPRPVPRCDFPAPAPHALHSTPLAAARPASAQPAPLHERLRMPLEPRAHSSAPPAHTASPAASIRSHLPPRAPFLPAWRPSPAA
jgi:hypothetical protein